MVEINVALPVLQFSVRSDSSNFRITIRNTNNFLGAHGASDDKTFLFKKKKKKYFPADHAIRHTFIL